MIVDRNRMQILPIPAHLRDVAMATTFCLSMGYNFGCMIASDTLFDSRGGFSGSSSDEDIADFEVLRAVAMATIWLSIGLYGVHIGATSRIQLDRPCAAAMRPYVKLL